MKRQRGADPTRPPEAKRRPNLWTSRAPLSSVSGLSHPLLELHPMFGNRNVSRILQTKLKVNEPGDQYERQADAVTELVMRMPDAEANGQPQVQRQHSDCASSGGICPEC